MHHGNLQLAEQTRVMDSRAADLMQTFMALQSALDEKDVEIRRLKVGYDADIFRKFLKRFIRVGQALKEFLYTEQYDRDSLEHIRTLLEDAFAECGLESFSPPIGTDYRGRNDVQDNPQVVPAKTPEDVGRVADLVEQGYRLRAPEGYEVIVPAKVKVFGSQI